MSADPAHAGDVRRAGEWVCDFVRAAGGEAELVETNTFPLAIGEIPASSGDGDAPTVLLYGHFDVQPPAPLDLWESDPFEPEIRDGYLYARGSVDDKGNSYLLLKAAELLAREGALPVNVRIAFDGEEETGGHSIVEFLEADERGADACIIFDSGMPREDVPAFDLGTRGLIYFHVRLPSGERDLHSGHVRRRRAERRARAHADPGGGRRPCRTSCAPESRPRPRRSGAHGTSSTRARTCSPRRARRPMDAAAAEDFYLRTLAGPGRGRERHRGRRADPAEDRASGGRRGERLHPARAWPGRRRDRRGLRAAPPRGGARRRRARDRALVVRARGAHLRPTHRPSSWRRTPSSTRSEAALYCCSTGGTLPIVPALADKGIPTILTGFSLPGANVHSPNERLLARYIPLGVAAARETLLAFKAL